MSVLCVAGACSSSAPVAPGSAASNGSSASTQGGAQDASGQAPAESASPAEASAPGSDVGTSETGAIDTGASSAMGLNAPDDASAPEDAISPDDVRLPDAASLPDDSGTGADGPSGQYSLTLNATKPYMLGAEHLGKTVYGRVVDTTAGANMAQVGPILSTPVTAGQQVKWVWADILVAGHTYVLGMFSDDAKNMTCVPNTDAGWIFQIAPAPGGGAKAVPVTGDVVIPWTTPVPRSDATKCQYFPAGPIADATAVPPP